MIPDADDVFLRPVGVGKPKRTVFGLRQILLTVLVLALGGGGGAAAYFLSDIDPKDIIAFLDIADPDRPHLAMMIPGAPQSPKPTEAPAPPGQPALFTPPGGVAPALPPPLVPETKTPEKKAPEVKAEAKPEPAKPGPVPKLIDPKMFANLVVPPSPSVARTAPPPVPRGPDQVPSFVDLPLRAAAKALAPAPEKALLGSSAQGPVPVISADGRQPWKVYARPFEGAEAAPRIAVVVTDLGLNTAATDAAIIRLPPEISLAFSPYAVDLAKWIKKARDNGHEVLAVLPVVGDAASTADPGPLGVNAAYADKQNVTLLQMVLTRSPGVVGVLTPPASFLSAPKGAPLLGELLQRGLLYVGQPPHGLRLPPMAPVTDVADAQVWRAAIDDRLAQAVVRAPSEPAQVLVVSARPVTLDALAPWIDGLSAHGIELAPVSAVAAPPGGK